MKVNLKYIISGVVLWMAAFVTFLLMGDVFYMWKKSYGLDTASDLHGYSTVFLFFIFGYIYYKII